MVGKLDAGLTELFADDAGRVIVRTGAGPVFCAGIGLKSNGPGADEAFLSVLARVRAAAKPVVCRLNGLARPARAAWG